LVIVIVAAALRIGSAMAVCGHGDGAIASWLQRIH
jgi:hypothetical protein